MASRKKSSPRGRGKDPNPRKYKKKTSPLVTESVEYIDYKDVDLLQRFMSDRAKIRNRRVTGNDVQQQREVANAIKIAREMGLLPYAKRVATASRQRPSRDGDRDRRPAAEAAEGADDVGDEITDETAADDTGVDDVGVDDVDVDRSVEA